MLLTRYERPWPSPPDVESDEEYRDRINAAANQADHDNQCDKDLED